MGNNRCFMFIASRIRGNNDSRSTILGSTLKKNKMKSSSYRKSKATKSESDDIAFLVAEFTLPVSLPTSEVNYPILCERRYRADWHEILAESDRKEREVLLHIDRRKEHTVKGPFLNTESEYVRERVFPRLLPALARALTKARLWNATVDTKCFFNGIDQVAQELWNSNPRYPERIEKNDHIFNMPWVREELNKRPRDLYPKSWMWPAEYAATLLQAHWRRYTVQKRDDVDEMRDFWMKLHLERSNPNIASNPLLAKKFASSKELHHTKRSLDRPARIPSIAEIEH